MKRAQALRQPARRVDPPAAVHNATAISVSACPAPLALVDPAGAVVEANEAFQGIIMRFTDAHTAVRETLREVVAESGCSGRAQKRLHLAGYELSFEGRAPQPGLPGAPVYASVRENTIATASELERLCAFVWASDGDGVLVAVSRDTYRLFNCPPQALVGRKWYDVFRPHRRRRASQRTNATQSLQDVTVSVRDVSGARRWFSLSATARFDTDGQFVGYVGIGNEITKLVAAEAALDDARRDLAERTQALKTANAELEVALEAARRSEQIKAAFLGNLSHEFHTPLNALIGNGEMLALGLTKPDPDVLRATGETIAAAGRRVLGLFDDALALATVESGQADITLDTLDAAALLGDEITTARGWAVEQDLDASGIADVPSVAIRGDAGLMPRILRCLLDNAVKFTPAQGRIGVQPTVDHARGVLVLAVWDTGTGIAPEDQKRIFEPFGRAYESAMIASPGGVGMGLALARAFARLQHGDLELEKTGPRGSRFAVSVPLADTDGEGA